MITNELQTKLVAVLKDNGAKWWGRAEAAERVYFNLGIMSGMKVWLQFADASTLAGAEIKARWNGGYQHPNWIQTTEAQWLTKYEGVIGLIATLRDEAGFSDTDNKAAIESAEEIQLERTQGRSDRAEAAARAAEIETSLERAAAESLDDLTSADGMIDVRAALPSGFTLVEKSAAFDFLVNTKTKAILSKWFKTAAKAADCRLAFSGSLAVTVRGGKGGKKSWSENQALITGVVCLSADAAKIRAALVPLETEAADVFENSPAAIQSVVEKFQAANPSTIVGRFDASQTGFSLMAVGASRTSAKGIEWTCVEAGKKWYVALGKKLVAA